MCGVEGGGGCEGDSRVVTNTGCVKLAGSSNLQLQFLYFRRFSSMFYFSICFIFISSAYIRPTKSNQSSVQD